MTGAPSAVGRRVIVTGLAGSGKSTFSISLAAKTGLPVIHLDLLFWKPGWVAPSETEWRETLAWRARRGPRGSPTATTRGHSISDWNERTPLCFSTFPGGVAQDVRSCAASGCRASYPKGCDYSAWQRLRDESSFGRPCLEETPFGTGARTRDHFAAWAACRPSRAQIQAGGCGLPRRSGHRARGCRRRSIGRRVTRPHRRCRDGSKPAEHLRSAFTPSRSQSGGPLILCAGREESSPDRVGKRARGAIVATHGLRHEDELGREPGRAGVRVWPAFLVGAAFLLLFASGASASGATNRFSWSRPTLLDNTGGQSVSAVACPSTTQCTAVDYVGHEVTFNPASPGKPTPVTVDAGQQLNGVACASTSKCTAVDFSGGEVTFNPVSPGKPKPAAIRSDAYLLAVACPSASQCTAVRGRKPPSGDVRPDRARHADPGHGRHDNLDTIACASTSQCTAFDSGRRGGDLRSDPPGPRPRSRSTTPISPRVPARRRASAPRLTETAQR